ncbi:hypothetical protein RQP46_009595 [Phenoliferia psychrophenolica]
MAPRKTFIIGVGMTEFCKPRGEIDYPELAVEAATKSLLDAGVNYDDVEYAVAGYCYGDSTCGQRALYALGMTQIPIINMEAGSLGSKFEDRSPPLMKSVELTNEIVGIGKGPMAAQLFGNGAAEYIEKTSATWEHVAKIAAKNHQHSVANPYSQFRNSMTWQEVMADKPVTANLTRAECCPTSDGAACAIVASEEFVKRHGLENQAIEIAGMSLKTDSPRLFDDRSAVEIAGSDMTRTAGKDALKQAGISMDQCCVVELHDCFAANELLVYDALGMCAPGKAGDLVDAGDNTYGGKYVVNPSGGLESKGHPLGATGIGMAFYIVNQLRGWAGPLQASEAMPGVAEAKGKKAYGLLHNLGLGGACVVGVMRRPNFWKTGGADGRTRLGYNHAVECKRITQADVDRVKSVKSSEYAAVDL